VLGVFAGDGIARGLELSGGTAMACGGGAHARGERGDAYL
jgi:hypothetical protein